jgi:hypothetical protein
MSGKEYVEKKEKIFSLLMDVDDELVRKFFDQESAELLDEKIRVLTDLKEGKKPDEIPEYYSILELYPKEEQQWD